MATVLAHSALTILELHLDAGVCLGTMALTKNALLLKQKGIFWEPWVELEGIEPSSGDAKPGAFYMFISVCFRALEGTELTLPKP